MEPQDPFTGQRIEPIGQWNQTTPTTDWPSGLPIGTRSPAENRNISNVQPSVLAMMIVLVALVILYD
jgi:hypothetical protein